MLIHWVLDNWAYFTTDIIINVFFRANIIDTNNNLADKAEEEIIGVISDSVINALERLFFKRKL